MRKTIVCGLLLLANFLVGAAWGQSLNEQLIHAAQSGDKANVEALIAKGADVNAKDDNGNTPLANVTAMSCNDVAHFDTAKLLIAKGANVNNKGLWSTVLIYAVRANCPQIVELLVANGAHVNAKDYDDSTPLDMAGKIAGIKNQQIMKAILLAPPGTSHIDFQKLHATQELNDKLSAAVRVGDKVRVETIIAEGADVNGASNGDTPLHEVARFGDNKDMVELLIAHGAIVDSKDNNGDTPLDYAASYGKKDTAEALIAHGADVNVRDSNGWTPLHDAVHMGNKDVAEVLIAHGADLNAKTNSGETPLQTTDRISDANTKQAMVASLQGQMGSGLNPQQVLNASLVQFKGQSSNDVLRKSIIDLALKQHPAIPAEAEAAAGRGAYIFKSAKSTDDTLNAAKEYLTAIELAPWVANYYFNLCTVLEKTPYTQQALHACELYLVAAPNAADAGEMQQRIAGLQYAAEKDKAQMKQRTAYIKSRGIDDLYRFGGITGTVSGREIVMKLFVDWTATPPKYQVWVGCLQGSGAYGRPHDLVSTDSWSGFCDPEVNMHLVIQPEGEGFVGVSDASDGSLRATLDDLFKAKQQTVAQAVMFSARGDQGDRFYIVYEQGGLDERHAGYAFYESDCNGDVLKKDPRALPDDFVSGEMSKGGSFGKFYPEVLFGQPNTNICTSQFASKTGYHFGEAE